MGKKIFISYKYGDTDVAPLKGVLEEFNEPTKARDYVTKLQELLGGTEHVNKGEKDDESLDDFKDATIQGKLADKIFDSTVTIVLISPNMKDKSKKEVDQWIPWEIAYSLKNKSRMDKSGNPQVSKMNAVLAVALPNRQNSYEYYIQERTCVYCKSRTLKTNTLFKVLSGNMFNAKEPSIYDCKHHKGKTVYTGDSSYILSVKWGDFIKNIDDYIQRSLAIKDNHEKYTIIKTINT